VAPKVEPSGLAKEKFPCKNCITKFRSHPFPCFLNFKNILSVGPIVFWQHTRVISVLRIQIISFSYLQIKWVFSFPNLLIHQVNSGWNGAFQARYLVSSTERVKAVMCVIRCCILSRRKWVKCQWCFRKSFQLLSISGPFWRCRRV